MLKAYRLELFFIGIIISMTILAWHGILNQTISGEGFYYFSPSTSFIRPNGSLTDILHNLDNFAKLATFILEHTFKGNMQPYMTFQLVMITLLNLLIYLTLKIVTSKSLLAFIGSLYFAVNITGNFQIYARGHFQWFLQRVPEFFPIFASIIFLDKFINQKRTHQYLTSLFFFVLAIFLTHYTTLFLLFFPSFLIVSVLIKNRKKKEIIKHIFLSAPFVIINYLIVSGSLLSFSTIKPNQTLLESFNINLETFFKISFQLVVVTIPYTLLQIIRDFSHVNLKDIVFRLIIPTYLIYGATGYYLYKKGFKNLNFVIASFFGLVGVLYLNIYLGRVIIYNEIAQGRYFFIPKLYLAIMVASFIYVFLSGKLSQKIKFLRFSLVSLLILIYLFTNIQLIWKGIRDSQYEYTGGRLMMNYLDKAKFNIPDGSIVMVPQPLMPLGEDFLKKYYSGQSTKFLYIDVNWRSKIPENYDKNKLFVFDYNDEFKKGGKADLSRIEVIDKSKEYRAILEY